MVDCLLYYSILHHAMLCYGLLYDIISYVLLLIMIIRIIIIVVVVVIVVIVIIMIRRMRIICLIIVIHAGERLARAGGVPEAALRHAAARGQGPADGHIYYYYYCFY